MNKKNKSRVVILGAQGFIGNAIAKKCSDNNFLVLNLSRQDIDLSQPSASKKLGNTLQDGDSVVVAAAVAPVKTVEMLNLNLRMAEQIVKACQTKKLKYFLNISSDAVYEDNVAPLTENSLRAPLSLHGVMHLARELCFDTLQAPVGTLCPTLVYGLGDPHNGYGPNQFSRLVKESSNIELFGKGEELRDHVFIDDVAKISMSMLKSNAAERLNVASGEVVSFESIATSCLKISGSQEKILYKDRNGPMPHNGYRAFDISKIRLLFPTFKPTLLRKGLEELF